MKGGSDKAHPEMDDGLPAQGERSPAILIRSDDVNRPDWSGRQPDNRWAPETPLILPHNERNRQ